MRDQIHIETVKAVPAVGGTIATIYAKANELDWTVIAAQCTVAYIALQAAYLLWKWYKEAHKGG